MLSVQCTMGEKRGSGAGVTNYGLQQPTEEFEVSKYMRMDKARPNRGIRGNEPRFRFCYIYT